MRIRLTDLLAPYQWRRIAFTLMAVALFGLGAVANRGCQLMQEGWQEMHQQEVKENGR